jgi:hypothetical protein
MVILVAAAALVFVFTGLEYRRGFLLERGVDVQLGARLAYRIPADGAIASDRVARFLAVRRALVPRCPAIEHAVATMGAVNGAAEATEPDAGTVLNRGAAALRLMPSIGVTSARATSCSCRARRCRGRSTRTRRRGRS